MNHKNLHTFSEASCIVAKRLKIVAEINPEEKWMALRKKEYKNCLVEPIYYEKSESEFKYYNKRQKQFYKEAKELILNDNFVNTIISTAKEFALNNKKYSFSPIHICEIRDLGKEIPLESLNSNYPRREIPINFKDINKPCEAYYNPEHCDLLIGFWRSMLTFADYLYVKENLEGIKKAIDLNSSTKEYVDNFPRKLYRKKLKEILDLFNLSLAWEESIELLLITGWVFLPRNIQPVILIKSGNEITISEMIAHSTQREDLIYSWGKVSNLKNQIFGKSKRTKSSSKAEYYLDLASSASQTESYRDVLDFSETNVPCDEKEEEKAMKKLYKGISRAKKSAQVKEPSKFRLPEYLEIYQTFIEESDGSYLL